VLKFKSTSSDGIKIESYTRQKEGKFFSKLSAEYTKKPWGTANLEVNNKTEVSISLKNSSLYKGLKNKLTGKLKDKKGKKIREVVLDSTFAGASFATNAKMTYGLDSETIKGEFSATAGEENLTVGGSYPLTVSTKTFDIVKGKGQDSALPFDNLSLGVELKLSDITCSLLTKPKSELEVGFVGDVASKTKLGGKFYVPGEGDKDKVSMIQLGVNHKLDSDTTLYGVFESTGSVKGTFAKKFADPKLTASFTFGMDLTKGPDLVKPMGISIALGDA